MSDEGFHEIQLNGKQLVFLFMAATVVSVVIFLCGVMVGRGVRSHGGAPTQTEAAAAAAEEPAASAPATTSASSATTIAAGAQPAPPDPAESAEENYYKDLTADKPTDGRAEKKAEPAPAPAPKPEPPAARPPAPPAQTAAAPPSAVTSGGFAVQIAALRERGEADSIVKRLASKGYQAYILNPVPGKPPVYRVQVGRFPDRAEANRIAARLKSEEQFSPWVTR